MKKSLVMASVILLTSIYSRGAELEWIGREDSLVMSGERSNYDAQIDFEGRYIVFESRDASIPEHKNRFRDIFIFDRLEKSIKKIDPENLERSNAGPSLSGDGRYVAYHSFPLTVALGHPPQRTDMFIYTVPKEKSLIQTLGLHEPSNGECLYPQLNQDGRFLLFTSNATNFFTPPPQPNRAVYIFDRDRNRLEQVSVSQLGMESNRSSADPRMSRDGRFIAFKSASTNLIQLQPLESTSYHLYLVDRDTHNMKQIDESRRDFDPNKFMVGSYDMDDLGETVVFEGRPRQWDNPDEVLWTYDLFVFQRSSDTVKKLTTGIFAKRARSPSLSADGRFITFVFKAGKEKADKGGLVVYDQERDTYKKIVDAPCFNPKISGNGRVIVFESDQKDLVPGAKPKVRSIYVVANPFLE